MHEQQITGNLALQISQREDIQTVTKVEHKVVGACIQLQVCNMSVILVVESFQSLLIFCSVHTGRILFRKSLDGQATDSHVLSTNNQNYARKNMNAA